MLCYNVNSLDALDKLKDTNCYALKEANKLAFKLISLDPYNFF